ncbi:unnamed protein product, partial [Medioppia subpectinata]
GNHDFLNSPTVESVTAYKNQFGDDYFTFWVDGCMFIVINVQFYKDHTNVLALYDEQDQWIDKQLLEAKAGNYKHVVVFQHIPWFLNDINEPLDEMFNIENVTRHRMVDKFHAAGVRAIFAGHYHRNAGGRYKNMELIVTSAIGAQSPPPQQNANSGYRVVTVDEDKISHKYVDIKVSSSNSVFDFNLVRFAETRCPPSATRAVPVMKEDSSEAKYRTACAMSDPSPYRPTGYRLA